MEFYSYIKLSIYLKSGIKGTKALRVVVRGVGQERKEAILRVL